LLFGFFNSLGQDNTLFEEGLSSKFTDNFTPEYKDYGSKDTTRAISVKFDNFKGRKLIFYDDFVDNRHAWPYWRSLGDSLLQECLGIENNFICRDKAPMADAYTNMQDGRKVVACFTPDQMFKYTSQLKLTKNYVVTFNPLSIKQVEKLPSNYYEGYCEHTTRIHRSFDEKNFGIETNIVQAVGNWGIIFGNFDSDKPYYYFQLQTDNRWTFYTIYPNSKEKIIELESGFMPISFASLEKVNINLKSNGQGGFKVEFWLNDARAGKANVTRMPMSKFDVGYRLDHNSIDGNNIVIANDISVFEFPVETYLDDNIKVSGAWKGVLQRGGENLYNVTAYLNEDHSGFITGRVVYQHAKFTDITITKKLRAQREKNIINFEETSGTFNGFKNKVMLHSMLQKGNMELYGSDSLIVNSCLATNLHRYGEFDTRLNVHSDQIYLSRVKKISVTPTITGYDSINLNRLIEIKNLYFQPDLEEIVWTEETKGSLDNLARELQIYFAKYEDRILLIHGHIDLGGEEVLSIFRAETVREELVQRGVKATIYCIGHGSSQRKSARRGDKKNRRVEIEVLACDSCFNKDGLFVLGEGTELNLIKDLPDEYIINAQFNLTPGGKFYVVMSPGPGMEELRWEIPNIAGGEMQALKIKKRYKIEEDAIMLEFYLDDVRVLTQSLTGYESFGFEVKQGSLTIVNLNIMGPDQ
jgi:outer membrane protein OmpA-like peptidoglycan-associated protein